MALPRLVNPISLLLLGLVSGFLLGRGRGPSSPSAFPTPEMATPGVHASRLTLPSVRRKVPSSSRRETGESDWRTRFERAGDPSKFSKSYELRVEASKVIPLEECIQAWEAGSSLKNFSEVNTWRSLVLARWMLLDAKGAQNFVETQSSLTPSQRRSLVGTAITSLTQENAAAGWRVVKSLPEGPQKYQLIQSVAYMVAVENPAQTLEEAKSVGNYAARNALQIAALGFWAATDPKAALNYANQHATKGEVRQWTSAILSTWCSNDPDSFAGSLDFVPKWWLDEGMYQIASARAMRAPKEALAWAKALPDSRSRQQALESVLAILSQSDPDRAIREASLLPGREKHRLLQNLANQFAYTDPDKSLKILELMPNGSVRQQMAANLFNQVAANDPREALSLLEWVTGTNRKYALTQLASEWSGQNPEEAMNWVRTLPEGSERNAGLAGLVNEWSTSRPEDAARLVLEASPGLHRGEMIQRLSSSWAEADLKAALAWARSVEDPAVRTAALLPMTHWMVDEDPAAAIKMVSELQDSESRDRAVLTIMSSWGARDPAAAAEWVKGFPEGPQKAQAMGHLLQQWANDDVGASEVWVNSLPEGEGKQGAVIQLIQVMSADKFEAGLRWSKSLTDPRLRDSNRERLATRWLQEDRSAAIQWIHSSDLSPEVKKQLIENPPEE